jgi:bacteriorhodopsin
MILTIGSLCFGVFVGYITYRTLARTADKTAISDLAAVIGAVGGGAVTTIIHPQTDDFGWYAIGLLAGFIAYGVLYAIINGKTEFAKVMGLPRPAGEIAGRVRRGRNAPTADD